MEKEKINISVIIRSNLVKHVLIKYILLYSVSIFFFNLIFKMNYWPLIQT